MKNGELIIPASAQFAMRKSGYEFSYAAAATTRFRDFRTQSSSRSESQMLPYYDRLRIITRIRQLVRDDPYCAALLAAYPIQIGASTMNSLAADESGDMAPAESFNDAHERAWLDYCRAVEFSGISLSEAEKIIWREDLISGEVFLVKLRSGGVQMIPSEFCFSKDGNNEDGDEQDGIIYSGGLPVAYRFGYRDKSGNLVAGKDPIDAANVMHFFFKDRPEQRRGVPRLAPVLNVLQDISEICAAKVGQVKTQSFISAVITKNYAPADAADLMRVNNSDGTRSDYQELRGNALYYLETGEDMKPFQSTINSTDFDNFLKSRLEAVGGAINMPPEVWIEGFRDSNYSSARATLTGWIRTVADRRGHLTCKLLEPLHEFWVEKNPALVRSFGPYDPSEVSFTFPGVPAIDESKQFESDSKALASLQKSYAQVYAEKGQFWDTAFKQIAREKQRAEELDIYPIFPWSDPRAAQQSSSSDPSGSTPADPATEPADGTPEDGKEDSKTADMAAKFADAAERMMAMKSEPQQITVTVPPPQAQPISLEVKPTHGPGFVRIVRDESGRAIGFKYDKEEGA